MHGLIHDPNLRDKSFQEPFTIGVVDYQGSFVKLQGFLGITIVHELPLLVSHSQASHVIIACPFCKRGTTGLGLEGGFHYREKQGSRGIGGGRKLGYSSLKDLQSQSKKIKIKIKSLKQLAPLGT